MSDDTSMGREPEGTPRRYLVEVPVTFKTYVYADDSDQASREASRAVFDAVSDVVSHTTPIRGMMTPRCPPPKAVWAGDELQPLPSTVSPQERSIRLFRLCFAPDGPHLEADEDVLAELCEIWPQLSSEERLAAHGAWVREGVDISEEVGDPLVLPSEVFAGDWDPDTPYPGYTAGETWNGWEVPYFTHDTLEAIVSDSERRKLRVTADGVCIWDPADTENEIHLTPQTLQTVDGLQALYRFDAGWCWVVGEPSDDGDEVDS